MQNLVNLLAYMDKFGNEIKLKRIKKLDYEQLLSLGEEYKSVFKSVYEE